MDRKTVALQLLERGTDFELLRQWAALRRDTLLKDFAMANPSDHGALACLQGQARELAQWINLEQTVIQSAK